MSSKNTHRPSRQRESELAIRRLHIRLTGCNQSLGIRIERLRVTVGKNCQFAARLPGDGNGDLLGISSVVGQFHVILVVSTGGNPVNRPEGRIRRHVVDSVSTVHREHLLHIVAGSFNDRAGVLCEGNEVRL